MLGKGTMGIDIVSSVFFFLAEAQNNVKHKSLKAEQVEYVRCIIICFREDVLAAFPTGL